MASPDTAARWVNGFENALQSLDFLPTRHPIAPEADYFGHTVRRLLYQPFRVLFYVTEAENEGMASVVILSVRHGSALPLGQESAPS